MYTTLRALSAKDNGAVRFMDYRLPGTRDPVHISPLTFMVDIFESVL